MSGQCANFPAKSEILADSVGDFLDVAFTEAVLEAVQDFLSTVTHDFGKPRAAVDAHKQGSVAQIGGLRVGGDIRVNQGVPDLDDFDFGAARVHLQIDQHPGNDLVRSAGADCFGLFEWLEVNAAPLGEDLSAGGNFPGCWHQMCGL